MLFPLFRFCGKLEGSVEVATLVDVTLHLHLPKPLRLLQRATKGPPQLSARQMSVVAVL